MPRAAAPPARASSPPWPLKNSDATPALVVGEVHHPVALREVDHPKWLTIPERGLYTGVIVCGAVGSGKTSACMRPFARQLLSWHADDPQRRMAGLVLEVKGDFCHQVRDILIEADRGDDYIEIGLGGRWQWNPLSAPWLDSYSLAYTVASLINQLFGKGHEPFWQQAYINLVRWVIELHRMRPGGWVTLQDVYRCTLEPARIDTLIGEVAARAEPRLRARIPSAAFTEHMRELHGSGFKEVDGKGVYEATDTEAVRQTLKALRVTFTQRREPAVDPSQQERLDAVRRWYTRDWLRLEKKLRSTIVEGLSVFLSVFDLPEVAAVFCPPDPTPTPATATADGGADAGVTQPVPLADNPESAELRGSASGSVGVTRRLPPLDEAIESGKVIALNMPAGTNPGPGAGGRRDAQTSLAADVAPPAGTDATVAGTECFGRRCFSATSTRALPRWAKQIRPGDEKVFALTRQCRLVPIVATQSISLASRGAWAGRGVAGAAPDAPDADLPVALR